MEASSCTTLALTHTNAGMASLTKYSNVSFSIIVIDDAKQ